MSKVKTDLDALDSKKLDLNNLDKSNWKSYRFDEIAQNISERVDPNNTDLTVYIGLEHIDSQSLHIKRNGTPDDVNGTKLKFYKGDIIFGRRRAYQRKAGIATWDGFCSAHALVLRANPDVIDPELFPFFLHSDLFMNRAVDISVGSLSPTINWSTLKHQEFKVPDIQTQKLIIEVLDSLEKTIRENHELEDKLTQYFDSFCFSGFKNIIENHEHIPLGKLISVPISNGVFKTKEFFGAGTLLVNVTDIYDSFLINPTKLERVTVSNKEITSFGVSEGDVIFNRSSLVSDGIGHTCLIPECKEDLLFECHLMRARPKKEQLDPGYLCRYCLSPFGRNYLISRSQTTTMTTINQEALNKMPIPIPPLNEQKNIANRLSEIEHSLSVLANKQQDFNELKNNIIRQVF
jgi:type I restriction enzyme S subunit